MLCRLEFCDSLKLRPLMKTARAEILENQVACCFFSIFVAASLFLVCLFERLGGGGGRERERARDERGEGGGEREERGRGERWGGRGRD